MAQPDERRGSTSDSSPSTRPGPGTNVNHVLRSEAKDSTCTSTGDVPTADQVKVPAPERKAVEMDDAWSCPICLSWFDMPVATPCGHSFCGGCIKPVVAAASHRQRHARDQAQRSGPVRPACPICREAFSPDELAPNIRLFEEMARETVQCRSGDCTVQLCPLRWKHHQSKCLAVTVECTHKSIGCDWKGARRDLPEHIGKCAYEKIKGFMPRLSVSLKSFHTKVQALDAQVAAQKAVVANLSMIIVSMQHKERRAVFPAVYALLWRPRDWRLYPCPHPENVLSNATLVCLAPIAFLAMRGLGVGSFGEGVPSMYQSVVCLVCLTTLGFLALVENDNNAPWHEVQRPLSLKGLRMGPTLVEISTGLVLYVAADGMARWKKLATAMLLLAPLTYPMLIHGLYRLQVKIKRVYDEVQRAHAQLPALPRAAEHIKDEALKVHGPVATGVFRAVTALMFGPNAVLAGQVLSRIGICGAAAVLGPETHDTQLERWQEMVTTSYPVEEKEHIRQLHRKYFRAMKAPFPRATGVTARGCLAAASVCLFVAIVYASRQFLGTIGYALMSVAFMDTAYLKWEVLVGQWVMTSLEQTTTLLNQDPSIFRNHSLYLLRSRVLVVWVVLGSMFFALAVMT